MNSICITLVFLIISIPHNMTFFSLPSVSILIKSILFILFDLQKSSNVMIFISVAKLSFLCNHSITSLYILAS